MSEINAIATNNYLLATQQEVSHDNTLSGNGTVDSPLGVVPGYNETVLWSGQIGGTGQTAQMSEVPANFESIRITWAENNGAVAKTYCQFPTDELSGMTAINFGDVYACNGHWKGIYGDVTSAGLLTIRQCYEKNFTSTAFAGNKTFYVYKIVGINRKENA